MSGAACETRSGCLTCGDEGIPMRVVEMQSDAAVCIDDQGTHHQVAVDLVAAVAPGVRLLVHAGVAIASLSEEEEAASGSARR